MAKFNKLDVPHQWKDEFTKYPHGYSIFVAMSKWVTQVNDMITNINQWNTYLAGFTSTFGELPQQMVELRQEMEFLLSNVNSDLTNITDEVAGLADTLLTHLTNYTSYLESELGEEHIIRSLPNGVKDEISGGSFIKKVSDEVFLKGSETWYLQSINDYGIANFRLENLNTTIPNASFKAPCEGRITVSGFKQQTTLIIDTTEEGFLINNNPSFYIRILASKLSQQNVAGFKAWLQVNPITLTYQLAEPELIDLPEQMTPNTREITRLSEQVDKLTNAIINLGGSII